MSAIKPEDLAATDQIQGLQLSNDGLKAIYNLKPFAKKGDHMTSAIWIADTEKEGSSRQLTSGLYNDHSAVFHPDGKSIYFLSDRHKAGSQAQLYMLPLEQGGEAVPLTDTENDKAVNGFKVSPDGRYIAYKKAREPTASEEQREDEKDDAKVFGDTKDNDHLHILTLSTRSSRELDAIPASRHVEIFFWNPSSDELMFSLTKGSSIEMHFMESTFHRISVRLQNAMPVYVCTHPHSANDDHCWLDEKTVVSVDQHDLSIESSCNTVRLLIGTNKEPGRVIYSGQEDSAEHIVALQTNERKSNLLVVEIAKGLDSRVDLIDATGRLLCTLHETQDDAVQAWDAKLVDESTVVVVALRSSCIRKEVPNIWSGRCKLDLKGYKNGQLPSASKIVFSNKLSAHFEWLHDADLPIKSGVFRWTAADGIPLDGIITEPFQDGADNSRRGKPLPTILAVHGGPYGRETLSYNPIPLRWVHSLATAGYCFLQPNYRGGSGRGTKFAEAAQGGVGTLDWTDTNSMIDEAVKRNIADPNRLGICGWSQGGFMTAWGVSQTKNKFKAAAMGAGVSDWGAMAAESDIPDLEMALGGSAPWTPSPDKPRNDPVRFVEGIKTAVLIIHGEKDERVPVGQAIGFMRGIQRHGKYPERSQMVLYPREGHQFAERKHCEDVLRRVREHFDTWLG